MAFQQGLSGLNASSKALDVISNNVANASNVGFKLSGTQFADVYASALNGASAGVSIGIGTQIGKVAQVFNQGNITPTNNPLDVAINGSGFFRMDNGGSVAYTRNGQFQIDKNGYIINSQGYQLTGYPASSTGQILPASPSSIYIDTADLMPAQSSEVAMGLNLDSRSTVPTNAWVAGSASPDPSTYNSSTSVTLYDSLGNSHIMTMYFRTAGSGNWDMYTALDGGATGAATAVTFDTSGQLTTAMPVTIAGLAVTTGAVTPFSVDFDLTGSTQYGSSFGVNRQTQDGFASGRLSGITIGDDGVIQGRYSNGQTRNLGQVVLANFANPQGLLSLGNNLWGESPTSGQPLVGAPGTGSLGQLTAGSVEESNVDLTAELVNMITAQRNYQANAQSIKTQDQVLQTLVNLR
ncbi:MULTISPECIES: flagellar hook protein FlgE [Uliginosibacterium]|uniref:Flagellar hook protein FlgE n=1 Tax=Uliginosibacterium aquaticum TaxID=2731212 RepID=A0ABX2IFR8_9RHOO|nr:MULTISPECIES: flagellar hook protein FlgE [Uliginosibacterium]NSL55536.1 flagellar hook protein FlgE [Uliginosibacterium aquaticum]PLK48442.1 flagellar hook protein FlgE [Uliginosibacterium sp. TH139]